MIKIKHIAIFCLSFSQLIGSSFLLSRHYTEDFTNDAHSYVEMANGNYDVTITHRYRFIVPLAAGKVATIFDTIGSYIWKKERPKLWSEKLGFLFVNTFVMSIAATVLFIFLSSFGFSFMACFVGLMPFLTSFHAIYDSSLPNTDSLYLLAIIWFFLALKTSSFWALLFSSILGILSKEAFFMFLPLAFLVKEITITSKFVIVTFTILVYISVRFYINSLLPEANIEKGISNAISHFDSVSISLARIVSIQGFLEIVSVFTFFYVPFFWSTIHFKSLSNKVPKYFLLIFPIVLGHILLSAELPRMLLYSFPIVCLFVAHFFESNLKKIMN